ncbi:hypothetical protein KVV02_003552 [Mortierella alpina]|uniref:Tyrosyl-DNA phosphodiesterase n=1 Tax=Mortierella alpina TaxID=64518 RepID=A0A9P8D1S1_MORAP|nr:hypothetical protein KVV02_003552 [Mortierella alpina]
MGSSDDDGSSPKSLSTTPASPDIAKPRASSPSIQKRPLDSDGSASELSSKKSRPAASIRYLDSSVRLMTVQRAPASHNVNCVSLESLLGDPDLELMVQINYMIEVDFVMDRVHESVRDGLKTIVYHGLRYTQDQLRVENTFFFCISWTHHTKAMILFFRDGTMQLVVHTANMIERDWRNKTQAAFLTARLPKKSQPSGLAACAFERDLIEYLRRYAQHEEITGRISQYDFTGVKGVLIGSVPGKFTGSERNKWGHLKLRAVLRQQVEIPRESVQSSRVVCQISSIGSLGKSSQDWLRGEFETSLNAHRHSNYMASGNADLCVVFPTADNVRTSLEGWTMGGSLPFQSTSYAKQAHYLNPLLHSWRAIKSGRERAMPHIKARCLLLANLSKPAWGELKDSTFTIKSYELGVLIFPGLYEDQADSGENLHVCMMNATMADPYPEPQIARSDMDAGSKKQRGLADGDDWGGYSDAIGVVPIRLPYDLPLTKYNFEMGDQVWLSDKFFPGQDDYGETLEH